MKSRRIVPAAVSGIVAALTLTSCSPGIPLAYHVTDDSIDIAFCESFFATSVEIDFGKYPPPFQGSLYSIAMQTAAGPVSTFGNGVPISKSMAEWTAASDSGPIPEDWERVDYSFYDADGDFVGGEFLFRRDVKSSDWAWTGGYNTIEPQCELDLD